MVLHPLGALVSKSMLFSSLQLLLWVIPALWVPSLGKGWELLRKRTLSCLSLDPPVGLLGAAARFGRVHWTHYKAQSIVQPRPKRAGMWTFPFSLGS